MSSHFAVDAASDNFSALTRSHRPLYKDGSTQKAAGMTSCVLLLEWSITCLGVSSMMPLSSLLKTWEMVEVFVSLT